MTDEDHPAVRAWAELDARVVETDCGGVPCYWTDMPLPRRARLSFRVGRADEPFSRAGISHLVEHLALSTLGERLYSYNGSVEGDLTSFTVAGTDAEIVEFFSLVCAALRRLPLDRLDAERTVLLTEAGQRPSNPVAALLWARYGATGWGLLGIDEHGLRSASGEEVQAWADERFNAANAALIMTGPPPAGLELDLPVGRAFGDAVSERVEQPLPTTFNLRASVIGVGGTVDRDRPGRAFFARYLQRAMTQRLRTQLGITYSVAVAPTRIDAGVDHIAVVADTLAEQAAAVSAAMYAELNRIAADGVDAADLERDVTQGHRLAQLPDTVGAALHGRLNARLHGKPYEPLREAMRALVTLQPADVAALAAEARDSAMWLLPPGVTLSEPALRPYVQWSPAPVRADRYYKPVAPQGSEGPVGLAIGEQGVSVVLTGSRFISVRWEDCVGAQWWSTGQWALFGKDGFRLQLDPQQWEHSDDIQATIDAHVPAALRIPMGEMARPDPPVRPKRRTPLGLRLKRLGILLLPTIIALAGWVGYATTLPQSSTGASLQPATRFSFDPATNQFSAIDTLPSASTPDTGHGDPTYLTMAVLGTGAALAMVRFLRPRALR